MKRVTRGYSGYYKNIYLRSSLEFCFAYYLDHLKIEWEYESETFYFEDSTYKPDFFIKENGKLIEIVEIKGAENYESGLKKVETLQQHLSIPIKIYTKKDLTLLYRNFMPISLNKAINIWQNEFGARVDINQSIGENNPMWGIKQSEKTKELISKKAKERFRDQTYKKKIIDSLIEHNRLNNFDFLRVNKVPRIIKTCACGNLFEVTEKSKRKFCSKSCGSKNAFKIATSNKSNIKKEIRNDIRDCVISWCKDNKDLVLKTKFNKITDLQPLFDLINENFKITDLRTISLSVLNKKSSRKELLQYLKSICS